MRETADVKAKPKPVLEPPRGSVTWAELGPQIGFYAKLREMAAFTNYSVKKAHPVVKDLVAAALRHSDELQADLKQVPYNEVILGEQSGLWGQQMFGAVLADENDRLDGIELKRLRDRVIERAARIEGAFEAASLVMANRGEKPEKIEELQRYKRTGQRAIEIYVDRLSRLVSGLFPDGNLSARDIAITHQSPQYKKAKLIGLVELEDSPKPEVDEVAQVALEQVLVRLGELGATTLDRVRALGALAALVEAETAALVAEAREQKVTWADIGHSLGISDSAAYRRFDPEGQRKHSEYRRRKRADGS